MDTKEMEAQVQGNYSPCFGGALSALRAGKRVARAGWNGKGMFAYMVPAASYPAQTGAAKAHYGEGAMVPYNAYFALKGVDDTVNTWVPSISDLFAEDWHVVEGFKNEDPPASPYAPHQQRVLDEKAELDVRHSKLQAFFGTPVFTGLDEEERERLAAQARVMGDYSRILGDRIAAF